MLRVLRFFIWDQCYTYTSSNYWICTCWTGSPNHSSLVATVKWAIYRNADESRTYSIVAIISQNIYCFGGGFAAHLVPPFWVSPSSYACPFIFVYPPIVCPFLSIFTPFWAFFLKPDNLTNDSCAFCHVSC